MIAFMNDDIGVKRRRLRKLDVESNSEREKESPIIKPNNR
jgi:hypothetical protein